MAFCAIGAIVLLRSAEISEAVRVVLVANDRVGPAVIHPASPTSSHPPAADRVADIKSWVDQKTDPDQRDDAVRFLAEFDLTATLLNAEVLAATETALVAPAT
jgi:hypothetical protein